MMKILFITSGFPSRIGQIHLYNLAKVLSQNHELSVISFEPSGSPSYDKKEQSFYKRAELIPLKHQNLFVKVFRSVVERTHISVITNRSKDLKNSIEKLCRETKFDLVLFEPLSMAQYSDFATGDQKVLFPVDAVSRLKKQKYEAETRSIKKFIRFIDYLNFESYERTAYNKFKHIIFVSRVDAEYTLRAFPEIPKEKIHTLPIGVDINYFHPKLTEISNELSVAFLGNMRNYINEHAMLWFYREVWQKLRHYSPDLAFHILGNDPSQRIRNLSSADQRILVTGYMDDFRPYLWRSAVFVSPLQMGTGMKNRVLQAMAMGKAVVASPLSVEGIEGVENWKNIIIVNSPDEFIDAILFLLRNRAFRENLGIQARFLAEDYSLEKTSQRFLDIANRATSNREHQTLQNQTVKYAYNERKQWFHS